ncbi:hypothetical protein EHQ58_14955 [Leptospira ognonensis]|uniref:Amidohydrolase-related domain-containing protein n=1 Tax=Leptospira ognonensis TaxID=2484945 RepID=A0A4R9JVT7_9LEPT|nr:hypothetical protein [Leptospira ognonensis]TGL57090.1 hypothetical protein EHQ58_14955 [Leptospira ognonensis]
MSQNLKMIGVRVWDTEKKSFGEISDIEIQKGLIKSIRPSSIAKKEMVRYLLPGFCDASVTLSSNSLGGEMTKEALPFHLLGFLSTGFSHVESVADPNLQAVREEISKGRLIGPIISQSQKPVLLPSHFPEDDRPTKQYQFVSELGTTPSLFHEKEDRSKILPVFLKRSQNNSYPQTELFRLRAEAEKNGLKPVIYSFIDPLSWEDAIDAGYEIIFHAIPPKTNLGLIQRRSYTWSPMLNITYIKSMKEDPENLKKKFRAIAKHHKVYSGKFAETFEAALNATGDPTKASLSQREFLELEKAMIAFPKDRLLFSSGSGHFGSYPGVGAILESELWLQSWKQSPQVKKVSIEEEKEPSFWKKIWGSLSGERLLQKTNIDPETLSPEGMALVDILTRKTCNFLGADHKGLIKEGGPAHFSVHTQNPFVGPLGIFAIESMVLGGKLVYTPKLEKVGKKP